MDGKQSMKTSVYMTLRNAILGRKLPPGKQLVEQTISSKMRVSRTPVRSAIEMLASEGLVEIVPNKGAFVINPTVEEIQQAYQLRTELEILAAEMATNRLSERDFFEMEAIIQSEKEAIFNKDVQNYINANVKFHMAIIKSCENKFLIEFAEKLLRQTSIYLILFDIFFDETSPQPYGYKEHLEIVRLLKEKDIKELKKALTKHFENAITSLNVESGFKELDTIFDDI